MKTGKHQTPSAPQRRSRGLPAVLAIAAGNDMLVTTDFEGQIAQVALALEDGTLTEERLDESVLRILLWKLRLGVIE